MKAQQMWHAKGRARRPGKWYALVAATSLLATSYAGFANATVSGSESTDRQQSAAEQILGDTSDNSQMDARSLSGNQPTLQEQPSSDGTSPESNDNQPPADQTTPPADQTGADDQTQSGDTPQSGLDDTNKTAPKPAARTAGPIQLAAAANTANVTVDARVFDGNTNNTTGIGFTLYNGTATGPTTATAYSCTVESNAGSCVITVDQAGLGQQYWVVQTSAALGTFANPNFYVQGNNQSAGSATRRISYPVGLTPTLASTGEYTMPTQAVISSTNGQTTARDGSLGNVVSSLNNNPRLKCTALKIAVAVDVSGSIDDTKMANYKNGIKAGIDALVATNTGAQLELFTFGTTSPASGSSWAQPSGLLNVNAGSNAQTLKNWVDAIPNNNNRGTQYTNWQSAINAVNAKGAHYYDSLVFLTDGAPNQGTGIASNESDTNVRALERAIFSANTYKSTGGRIVGVGVALTTGVDSTNLRAISGDGDYHNAATFQDLGTLLADLAKALATCTSVVSIEKYNGTGPDDPSATLVPNWEVSTALDNPAAGVSIAPTTAQKTGADGSAANWTVTIPTEDATFGVKVSETLDQTPQMEFRTARYRIGTGAWQTFDGSQPFAISNIGFNSHVYVQFYNTKPQVDIEKSVKSVTQNPDGTWKVDYTIDVTNTAGIDTTYTLKDTLKFGASITPESGSWTGPTSGNFAAPVTGQQTLATDHAIDAGDTQTYTVSVIASVDLSKENDTSLVCSTDGSTAGGFLNTAVVTSSAGDSSDWACAPPPVPKVQKDGISATIVTTDGLGSSNQVYDLVYRIEVTNPIDADLPYTLTDTTPTLPSFVTMYDGGTWHAKIIPSEDGTTAPAGDLLNADKPASGPWTVAQGTVPAEKTYTFEITARVHLEDTYGPSDITNCPDTNSDGIVLVNGAAVKSGDATVTDDGCVAIQVVDVQITKTVVSTQVDETGVWTVTYRIDVELPVRDTGRTGRTTYNLTDDLRFGGGIDVTSASWQQVDPTTGAPLVPDVSGNFDPLTKQATLATAKPIGGQGGPSHHAYLVTAVATIQDAAWTADPSTLDCPASEDSGNGGFLNHASISWPAGVDEAEACSTPDFPQITKTGTAATPNSDGSWTLTYDVAVNNGVDSALPFTLTDAPEELPTGITLQSGTTWTATAGSGAPLDTASKPATGDWTLVSGTIPAQTTYRYTISARVDVDPSVSQTSQRCEDTGTTGVVLPNTAVVVSGAHQRQDDGCVAIPLADLTVLKQAGRPNQLSNGNWQIEYRVVVSNPTGNPTAYDLNDAIKFGSGFTVVGGSWWNGTDTSVVPTGTIASGQTSVALADNKPIAAYSEHTYTIRIQASLASGAWDDPVENQLACPSGDEPGNGGFLNTVHLAWPGGTDDGQDCLPPIRPTVDKQWVSTTQSADDPTEWLVAYDLTVSPPSAPLGSDVYYALKDVPGFPVGVEVVGGTWQRTSDSPVAAPTAIGVGGVIQANRLLAANTTDTYRVVWTVRIADPSGISDVKACTEVPTSGHGFFNRAALTISGSVQNSDACGPIQTGVSPTVQKSVVGDPQQNDDGTWTIDYDVTVTLPTGDANPLDLSAKYDLADALNFGAGITVNSAKWGEGSTATTAFGQTGGVWHATLATGKTITVTQPVHTYRVTVNATVTNAAVGQGTIACPMGEDTDAGGFLNTASMTSLGQTTERSACAEPVVPTVAKTGLAPVLNSDGTWTVSYQIVVANQNVGQDLVYTAKDTVPTLPQGMTLATGSKWTASIVSGAPAGDLTAANPPTSGEWAFASGTIPGASTYTFLVSAKVVLDPSASYTVDRCADSDTTGVKLVNTGQVVSGGYSAEDDGCTAIPLGQLQVTKSVTSATQGSDGAWTVVYNVKVDNLSTTTATAYDLSDQLQFGGDIMVTGASWTGETTGTFADNATSAKLAERHVIAAESSQMYTVTVTSTIDPEAWTSNDGDPSDSLTCHTGETPEAGGFLNTAELTWPGGQYSGGACETPSVPTMVKTFTGATQSQDDPDQWSVGYLITVTGGQQSTFYDVTDTPGFASGIEVVSGSAQRLVGGEPVGNVIPVVSGMPFVTGQAIDAGAVHTYRVTWTVSIPSAIPAEVAHCAEVPTSGYGFFNQASLDVGGVAIGDSACGPVDEQVVPTVAKTVTSSTQGSDGKWTVVYDVAVTLPTGEEANPKGLSAKYNLTDQLNFGDGLDVTSASWTGPGDTAGIFEDGSATLASGMAITPEDPEHIYTVTVVADVTNKAIDEGTLSCGSGEESAAGGFLNTAQLSSGGTMQESDACADPAVPTIVKSGEVSVPNEGGSWNIAYVVTVSNPNSQDLVYQLTDQPEALPEGVTLVAGSTWKASPLTESTPSPTNPTWNGSGTWTIGGGSIAAEETHSYWITAKVTVAPHATFEFSGCADLEQVGIVLPNQAAITSGAYRAQDSACTVIQPPASWTLTKSSEPPSGSKVKANQEITYTLTATNTGQIPVVGATVKDDLSKVLNGATLVSPLDATLSVSGTTMTWQVPDIEVGQSMTVTYKVKVGANVAGVKLVNVAAPGSPGGECVADKCTTTHEVPPAPPVPTNPPKTLSKTGASIFLASLLALGAIGAGGGLLWSRRRKDSEQSA